MDSIMEKCIGKRRSTNLSCKSPSMHLHYINYLQYRKLTSIKSTLLLYSHYTRTRSTLVLKLLKELYECMIPRAHRSIFHDMISMENVIMKIMVRA